MNCQECHDYIDAYIDNELDISSTILVKQHLRDCPDCRQLLESRKAVGALLDNPQVRFEVPDSLLGRIQSALPVSRPEVKQQSEKSSCHSLVLYPLSLGGNNRRYARAGLPESRGRF